MEPLVNQPCLTQPPTHQELLDWLPGPHAGHKALHTCTSWYAYAAMFSSSFRQAGASCYSIVSLLTRRFALQSKGNYMVIWLQGGGGGQRSEQTRQTNPAVQTLFSLCSDLRVPCKCLFRRTGSVWQLSTTYIVQPSCTHSVLQWMNCWLVIARTLSIAPREKQV